MTRSEERGLGPVLASFIVAGNIIGGGIFALPAAVGAIGGVSLVGWMIAAIGAFAIGAVVSLLAGLTGDPDGIVGYVRRTMGPSWAFLVGVIYWFSNFVGGIGIAVACAGYLSVYVPALNDPLARSLTGVAALWLTTGVNLIGARAVGRFSGLFLIAGLTPLLMLATVGWLYFQPHLFVASWNVSGRSDLQGVQASVMAAFWAFTGMETGAMLSAVMRNPRRDVPISALGGVAFAAIVYFCVLIVILGLAPARAYATSGAPLALAVSRIGGGMLANLVAAFALIKILGTMTGMTLANAEVARALIDSRRPSGPAAAADVGRVPRGILVWTAAISSAATLATTSPTLGKQFLALVDLSAIWTLIPYVFCAMALALIARRQQGRARTGYLAVALIAAIVTGGVLLTASALSYVLTAIIVAVILAYQLLAARGRISGDTIHN